MDRNICDKSLLRKLNKKGIKTTGKIEDMEDMIKSKGFNLPGPGVNSKGDIVDYGFVHGKQVRIRLNYVDALAEEILFLIENKLW